MSVHKITHLGYTDMVLALDLKEGKERAWPRSIFPAENLAVGSTFSIQLKSEEITKSSEYTGSIFMSQEGDMTLENTKHLPLIERVYIRYIQDERIPSSSSIDDLWESALADLKECYEALQQ